MINLEFCFLSIFLPYFGEVVTNQLSLVEEMVVGGENRRLTTSYWHLSRDSNPAIGVVSGNA